MQNFSHKKINAMETVGEKLRQHREYHGLTIEQAARAMNMNARYLALLEKNDYKHLPAEVYTKNFLRQYAVLLNLNADMVVDRYVRERNIYARIMPAADVMVAKHWYQRFAGWLVKPYTIKGAALVAVSSLVVAYLGWNINKIFAPPELIVTNPATATIMISERALVLEGISEKEVDLTINAKPILSDTSGRFSIPLDLQKGLNIVKISARKKHSRPQVVYRQIIVDDSAPEVSVR